jgi:hypothetical protein
MRRTEYPVRAPIALPQGALRDNEHAVLRAGDAEVAAQYTAASRWPDGSVKQLDIDFNASLAPGETKTYALAYGDETRPQATPRGLAVSESAEAIQVGNTRFSKNAAPLIASANYRGELISSNPDARNGIAVTTKTGTRIDVSHAEGLTVDIVKRGPLNVELRYAGRLAVDAAYSTPFVLDVEMPNSKSWVKLSAVVEDPGRRLSSVAIETPLSFGAFPWTWDVATANGTYGAFRTAADSVMFTQTIDAKGGNNWRAEIGPDNDRRLYEASTGGSSAVAFGWSHFQGANAAVAFAIDNFGKQPGAYSVSLNGRGQASFSFAASEPAPDHRLTLFEHFVSTPVPIGAATSPASILRPPTVAVGR